MANEVEIIAKFTTASAMTAINWFQKKLQETQIIVDKLNDSFSKFGKKSTTAKINSDIKQATTSINDLSKWVKWATVDLTKMDSQPIKKLQKEADELKKKMNFKSDWPSFWNNMARAFSKVWDEIARSTKLLTAFWLVSGGIIANRAKNQYLDYSAWIVWLQNVTWANTPESKAILDKMVANISKRTWIAPAEVPTNIVDTASWGITVDLSWPNAIANAKSFEEIQVKIWLFWKWFWASAKEVNSAVVALWHALWKSAEDLNNPKVVDELTGLLAITLKKWKWSLSEYATSIPKFISTYVASASNDEEKKKLTAEALAIFSQKTLSASPAMAWFTTKSFWEDLWNMLRQTKAGSTKITNLLKDKKDSEWNLIKFSFLWDEAKTKKVQSFLNPFENADYMRKNIFLNKQWVQGSQFEVAQNITSELVRWEKETGIKKWELLSLFTTNTNTRKALLAFMDEQDEIAKLRDRLLTPWKWESYVWQTDVTQAIDNVQKSVAFTYSQISANFDNLTNKTLNDLAPAMNNLFSAMSEWLSWTPTDIKKMNDAFNENIATLQKTSPVLATVAWLMKDFWNYIADPQWAKEDLIAIKNALVAIWEALNFLRATASAVWNSWPLKAIREMFPWWGWTIIDIWIMIWWYSALKVWLWAAISWAFTWAWATVWATWIWTTIWKAIWPALLWAWIWMALWKEISNWIKLKTDEDLTWANKAIKAWEEGKNFLNTDSESRKKHKALVDQMWWETIKFSLIWTEWKRAIAWWLAEKYKWSKEWDALKYYSDKGYISWNFDSDVKSKAEKMLNNYITSLENWMSIKGLTSDLWQTALNRLGVTQNNRVPKPWIWGGIEWIANATLWWNSIKENATSMTAIFSYLTWLAEEKKLDMQTKENLAKAQETWNWLLQQINTSIQNISIPWVVVWGWNEWWGRSASWTTWMNAYNKWVKQ